MFQVRIVGVMALLLGMTGTAPGQNVKIVTYPVEVNANARGITTGPDGALWFAQSGNDKIGRITTGGVVKTYYIGYGLSADSIVTGPDGALWFTLPQNNEIGRITTAGVITRYLVPTPDSFPLGITTGSDGALWFTESGAWRGVSQIGRVTPEGVFTEYPVPPPAGSPATPYFLVGIAAGQDGALWFTEGLCSEHPPLLGGIGRITVTGELTEFPIPWDFASCPGSIATGPDGALWFSDWEAIGRLTTDGVFSRYPLPTSTFANQIISGPDGAIWFIKNSADVGRMTSDGAYVEYSWPHGLYGADTRITSGPNGALWFTAASLEMIGQVILGTPDHEKPVSRVSPLPEIEAASAFKVRWTGTDVGWGVRDFTVYASEDGGPFVPWLERTAATLGTYGGAYGHRYAFYSIARDRAGNYENPKTTAEAVTLVMDDTKPSSRVAALPPVQLSSQFVVNWSGTDNGGIRDFSIYVSSDDGPFATWLTRTAASQAVFPGTRGHRYGFYSIAEDLAGNWENAKAAAEASTSVPMQLPGDLNQDGLVNCADLAIVKASFGKRSGQAGFDARADTNGDGVVNIRDLSWLSRKLPPATQCQ